MAEDRLTELKYMLADATEAKDSEAISYLSQQINSLESPAPSPMGTGGQWGVGDPTTGESGIDWGGVAEELPQVAGSTAGAIRGAALAAPIPVPGARLAGAGIGAFLGGAAGEGSKQVGQHIFDAGAAPRDSEEALKRMLYAGAEEAAWELGGGAIGGAARWAGRKARPFASEGIDTLSKAFEEFGGHFTATQRSENWMLKQLDSLTRGSLTGSGVMKRADLSNTAALSRMQKDLSNKIASSATTNLSDAEFGELVLNTVSDGKAAFGAYVGNLYGQFDDLVRSKSKDVLTRFTEESKILTATGKPITKETLQRVKTVTHPVNMAGFKNAAESLMDKYARIKKVGIGDIGESNLTRFLNQEGRLSFSDAQNLRSSLLDLQRGLKRTGEDAKFANNINEFVGEITAAMDTAAEGAGKLREYSNIKKIANTGYKTFNDDFVAKLIVNNADNPAKISDVLFRAGNVQEINNIRKAVKLAAVYDRDIDSKALWGQIQQHYLEDVIEKTARIDEALIGKTVSEFQEGASVVSGAGMLNYFKDGKKNRTLTTILTDSQQKALFDFAKTASIVQKKPEGSLGMIMQLTQGGAIAGLASGVLEPGQAGAVFLSPYIMAKLLTNPRAARLLTKAAKTPKTGASAVALMGKIGAAVNRVQEEDVPIPMRRTFGDVYP